MRWDASRASSARAKCASKPRARTSPSAEDAAGSIFPIHSSLRQSAGRLSTPSTASPRCRIPKSRPRSALKRYGNTATRWNTPSPTNAGSPSNSSEAARNSPTATPPDFTSPARSTKFSTSTAVIFRTTSRTASANLSRHSASNTALHSTTSATTRASCAHSWCASPRQAKSWPS